MKEFFISPILFDSEYLEKLSEESAKILDLDLNNEELKKALKTSIFLNFNRYLTIELALMSDSIRDNFLEELAELLEAKNEKGIEKLLTDLEILPETKEKFLEILKKIKEAQDN